MIFVILYYYTIEFVSLVPWFFGTKALMQELRGKDF
jgi:hypothetical protein